MTRGEETYLILIQNDPVNTKIFSRNNYWADISNLRKVKKNII